MQEWTLIVFIGGVIICCLTWLWLRSRKKSRWESQFQNLVSLKKREKKEREEAIRAKQKKGKEIIRDFWPRVRKACKRFAKRAKVRYRLYHQYSYGHESSEWGDLALPCVVLDEGTGGRLEIWPAPEGIYVLEKWSEWPRPKYLACIPLERFSEERLAEVLMKWYFKVPFHKRLKKG